MGALTSNRKRVDESFNPSNLNPYYRNHIDTHIAKKSRTINIQTLGRAIPSQLTTVSRLNRYPEAEKLKRELHAPVRAKKSGLLSSGVKCRDRNLEHYSEPVESMGNVFRKLERKLKEKKHIAYNSFRYKKDVKNKNVIDVEAEPPKEDGISKDREDLEVIEVGSEERPVVSDYRRVVENGGMQGLSVVPDLINVERPANLLNSVDVYKKLLSDVYRDYSNLSSLKSEIGIQEARWQSLLSLRKPKQEIKPEKELKLRETFVPLTEEEKRDVARAFSNSNRRKILVNHENSNIQITGELLQCLRPGAWLNDEVINVYLELLKERERREPKKFLNCHFFNTFFYKKLVGGRNGYDYKAVRRWTTQRKIGYGLLDCDKIFIPIHKEVHWCLAVINKKDKSFQYLDSLGGRDRQVLGVLARYFADEVKDKSGQEIDVDSWNLEFVEDLPEQQNGFDCGVFMIKYADFYSRDLGLHFSQENMPYFRQRTAKEILRLRAD